MATEQKNLSKFEKARMLGARTLQISENAPLYTDAGKNTYAYDLALKEFKDKKSPLRVVRKTIKDEYERIEEEVK